MCVSTDFDKLYCGLLRCEPLSAVGPILISSINGKFVMKGKEEIRCGDKKRTPLDFKKTSPFLLLSLCSAHLFPLFSFFPFCLFLESICIGVVFRRVVLDEVYCVLLRLPRKVEIRIIYLYLSIWVCFFFFF